MEAFAIILISAAFFLTFALFAKIIALRRGRKEREELALSYNKLTLKKKTLYRRLRHRFRRKKRSIKRYFRYVAYKRERKRQGKWYQAGCHRRRG